MLTPVSFRKGRAHAPRLSTPYVPGRHAARFWTEEERAIIRQHYPKHGAAVCVIRLAARPGARQRTISGVYTQAGIAPSFKLAAGKSAPSLGVPLVVGVGWNGFYQAGTGNLVFGSAGLSLSQPVQLGNVPAKLQASALALVRDNGLRRLVSADGETATVVPYVQLGLTIAL